jgi:hypothetical protein
VVAYVGGIEYHVVATERNGLWFARTGDSAEPFGLETSGPTEAVAIQRLTGWLAWQHEHAAALQALQAAERVYHRTIALNAFANPVMGPDAGARQKESLEAVEAARIRLDGIRARQPGNILVGRQP